MYLRDWICFKKLNQLNWNIKNILLTQTNQLNKMEKYNNNKTNSNKSLLFLGSIESFLFSFSFVSAIFRFFCLHDDKVSWGTSMLINISWFISVEYIWTNIGEASEKLITIRMSLKKRFLIKKKQHKKIHCKMQLMSLLFDHRIHWKNKFILLKKNKEIHEKN